MKNRALGGKVSISAPPRSPRIIVVDGDERTRHFVCRYLQDHGFQPIPATDGADALVLEQGGAELMLLELKLRGMDGLDIIRRLRAAGSITPILVLSARDEESEMVSALEVGADDYVIRPFRPRELVARIRAQVRRALMPRLGTGRAGPVVIDGESGRAVIEGMPLDLSPLEHQLLELLVAAPSKNFSRDELLSRLWGRPPGDTRRVDLLVSKLRARLRPLGHENLIRSVWGVGYRYECS